MKTALRKAIIVGGGHNGLVAACELATTCEVLVLEALNATGGAAVTDTFQCGCRVSSGANAFSMMPPFLRDRLRLAEHGVQLIDPDPQHSVAFPDGRCIDLWCDRQDTLASIAQYESGDCASFDRFSNDLSAAADAYAPFHLTPAPSEEDIYCALELASPGLGNWFLRASIRDTLAHYFRSHTMQAFVTATLPLYPCNSDESGSSFVLTHLAQGRGERKGGYSIVKGGMGQVTEALVREATSRGVTLRTGARVASLHVNGSQSSAVLTSGERITADLILSGIDPVRTRRLLGFPDPPHEQLDRLFRFGAIKLNLVLENPPAGPCPTAPVIDHHRSFFVFNSSLDLLDDALTQFERGLPPHHPYMELSLASRLDTTLSCSDRHLPVSLYGMFFPDHLAAEAILRLVIAELEAYWPGVGNTLRERSVLRSAELEQRWGMFRGNVDHGNLSPDNRFECRPASCITVPRQVTLCGSGRHPGGLVSGLPGYFAAAEVNRGNGNG